MGGSSSISSSCCTSRTSSNSRSSSSSRVVVVVVIVVVVAVACFRGFWRSQELVLARSLGNLEPVLGLCWSVLSLFWAYTSHLVGMYCLLGAILTNLGDLF